MANYDYKCRKCDDIITISHSVNDKPTIICGKCISKRIKLFSAPGIEFKGSGWGKD